MGKAVDGKQAKATKGELKAKLRKRSDWRFLSSVFLALVVPGGIHSFNLGFSGTGPLMPTRNPRGPSPCFCPPDLLDQLS